MMARWRSRRFTVVATLGPRWVELGHSKVVVSWLFSFMCCLEMPQRLVLMVLAGAGLSDTSAPGVHRPCKEKNLARQNNLGHVNFIREEKERDKLNVTNGFLQNSAVSCGFLRKSAEFAPPISHNC